jgi:hypothetical protein
MSEHVCSKSGLPMGQWFIGECPACVADAPPPPTADAPREPTDEATLAEAERIADELECSSAPIKQLGSRMLRQLVRMVRRQRSSPSLGELGTLHRCMGDSCAVVLPLAEIRHHSVRHDHAYDPTPVGTEREFARLHHVIDMAAIHATSAGVNYLHDDCRKARAFVAALDARLAALVAAQRDVEEMLAGLLDRTSHGIGDCPRAWVIDNVRDILDVARAAHPPEGSHGR